MTAKAHMALNIVRPFLPALDEIALDLGNALKTGLVTNGSQHVRAFEQRLTQYFQSPIAASVNCNGELALFNLIQAWKAKLGYGPHETFDVLVPSFTFSGTVNAVVANNLKPVFCDVDEGLVLDLNKLEVNPDRVKMILPVAAYGNLVDLEKLGEYSAQHQLAVVLDNAPAFGSKFKNRFPCHYGFSEMISFHATKIFSCMEGGANIVNDPDIADYLLRLRDFGQYEKVRGDVDIPGLNSKMAEVCAIVGLKNFDKVDEILSLRRGNVERYLGYFDDMEKRGHLKTMKVNKDVTCPYLYFPIILNHDATDFVTYMTERAIGVRRYYTATHDLKFYRGKYRELDLSFTNAIKDRVVALPLHTRMTNEEIEFLFDVVDGYFRR